MSIEQNDVLLVEDSTSIALVYQSWLAKHGVTSDIVGTGGEALERLRQGSYQLVLLDLQLPDVSGLEVLDQIQNESIAVSVVVVTSSGSITVAVDAMRRGAYDFVVKPAAEERLTTTAKNALEREGLHKTIRQIRTNSGNNNKHGFIGSSLPMLVVYKTIEAVAQSAASIFVTGESGSGKEVCATAIHLASARSGKPFVALNCAAIPKDLIESEVFGHIKGAFTGATTDRDGAAISASGGTLFLDEICEMDLGLQAKLLRFLQTGTVQRVGSDKTVKVDVRIICASNKDPLLEVEAGRFREDLYYRIHVVPVHLPPLRDRESDVLEISVAFLKKFSDEEGKNFSGFTPDAENVLLTYHWPGNVRELQNVLRNAIVLNDAELVDAPMLNITAANSTRGSRRVGSENVGESSRFVVDLTQPFVEIERQIIEEVIVRNDNSIPKASDVLELSPSTIYRKKENWK